MMPAVSRLFATIAVVQLLLLLQLSNAAAAQATAADDWSFCPGLAASVVRNGSMLCPAGWQSRYVACNPSAGAIAPLDVGGYSTRTVDASLRPLELSWFPAQRLNFVTRRQVSFSLVPLDVNPALWEPNEREAYALRRVDFYSPSMHTVGGGRYDLELQFVHTRRRPMDGSAALAEPRQLIVSMLFAASPVHADNEALRMLAFPVVVKGLARVNASVEYNQIADFAAIAPASRDYVRYEAAAAKPPCQRSTVYYVMSEVGTVSLEQVNRIRAVLDFATSNTVGGPAVETRRPALPLGNVPPLRYVEPSTDTAARMRQFVDFVGETAYNAEPKATAANKMVDNFALAGLVLSCGSVAIALLAARLSRA
jgi:carbonic anhydrase